jgi:hypothetical protein
MPPNIKSVLAKLLKSYVLLKASATADAKGDKAAQRLADTVGTALKFLESHCVAVPLTSKVSGKSYFSFALQSKRGKAKLSRPVNKDLFVVDLSKFSLEPLARGKLIELPPEARSRFLYTVAMSYCCAADILKTGDQKTPATFFECLIGHLLARAFGTNPRTQVEVLRLEEEASTLPTDFIFDLGRGKPKFHVPVKISTRERVIQVFAHQRVLDGVHGFGRFTGILVCLTETKLDHERREVIEICVPKQWGLYQRFIAPMHRFYYFDIPKRYAELAGGDPPMAVMNFAKFFEEAKSLAAGGK